MTDVVLFVVSAGILGWVAVDAVRRDIARMPRLVPTPPAQARCVRLIAFDEEQAC